MTSLGFESCTKDAHFVQGSITDEDALSKCFSLKPDYVVHMAALFANQNSVDHPLDDLEVNGEGTLKVLQYSEAYGVQKLLYTSSSCVYGNGSDMKEEQHEYFPDTPYAITKLLGERYCGFWASHHNLNIATVRLFNTYGPGEFPGKYRNVIPNFIQLAIKGKPLTITGTGEETRDFTFVDDTVEGIHRVLFDTPPNAMYNIATGYGTSIQTIAELVNAAAGNSGGINYLPRRQWDHVKDRKGNISKISGELGFEAKTDIENGIEQTYRWIAKSLT